jgi:hypothetical protein
VRIYRPPSIPEDRRRWMQLDRVDNQRATLHDIAKELSKPYAAAPPAEAIPRLMTENRSPEPGSQACLR